MKIVLIDSGIDQILRSSGITYGRNLLMKNKISIDDQGHGTLCARTIMAYCNNTPKIHAIKILDKNNRASSSILLEALKECEKIDCRLINLSLATRSLDQIGAMESIIETLTMQGKIVVSSAPNSGGVAYPAALKNVIGVNGAVFDDYMEYWYNEKYEIQGIANRVPILIQGLDGQYKMFGGTSKATCVMTAIIANQLDRHPDLTKNELQEVLASYSAKQQWNSHMIDEKSKYFVDTTTAKSNKERNIKELIEEYIEKKGLRVTESDYIKYGYQPYLTGNEFHSIIKLVEKELGVLLPTYDGISYRIFDNAVTMCQYFEKFS